jgi:7-cyano-7-deazaguanine synthase
MAKILAIVSGGLDSVTLAHSLRANGHDVSVVSFNYGQRHVKELHFAEICARDIDGMHEVVDMRQMLQVFSGSSLTSKSIEVPDGHYAAETMKITVVPNRNAIMLNIACALAISRGFDQVAIGVHGGDHYIYPDCRPLFIKSQKDTLMLANEGFLSADFELLSPFIDLDKAGIVGIGDRIGVPWENTWSCYKGEEVHCGSCGTCFERREAFVLAGVHDPTDYASTPDFVDPR